MTAGRLVAIVVIYLCTAFAWSILGGSVVHRTGESDRQMATEVAALWGGQHTQVAPQVSVERPRVVQENQELKDAAGVVTRREVTRTVIDNDPLPLVASRVKVDLDLDQRRKGLLWYNTYGVNFAGTYRLRNPDAEPRTVVVQAPFPSAQAIYDGYVFKVDGQEAPPVEDLAKGPRIRVVVPAGGEAAIELAYRSRGLGQWTYGLASGAVAQVRDFQLDLNTDFAAIDFPEGTLSPTARQADGSGWKLQWKFASIVTGQKIGMDPPRPMNPGPLAARITFFAPVSLLFFMTVMVMLGVLRGPSLHPVNYFFLAAAFFAFHLLLAYLVDHLALGVAFAIAAVTSVLLVVSYLRLVGGMKFAVLQAGTAQILFLVLFSFAFFFEGYTGLTVTVGAVVTLFVLMQMTARVDWAKVFGDPEPARVPVPVR